MNFNDTNTNDINQQGGPLDQPPVGQDKSALPLGTGDDGFDADSSFDPLAGAESGKRSNTGTLLIIAVILVAAGGLFSMRTLAKVTASVQADPEAESSIESFFATLAGNTSGAASGKSILFQGDDPTLDVLGETYTDHQVPWVNVGKNPFQYESQSSGPAVDNMGNTNTTDRVLEQRRRAKLQSIELACTRVELTSVLMGSSPLANINGKILRVGETIMLDRDDVTFRVLSISADSVTLVAADEALNISFEYTAKIDREN